MAGRRTTMRKVREIFRLVFDCGLSHRQTAKSCRISPTTVGALIKSAKAVDLTFEEISHLSDEGLRNRLLRCDRSDGVGVIQRRGQFVEPDWPSVIKELKRKGVTRRLLWEEYRHGHEMGYSYTRFCERLRMHLEKQDPTLRIEHKFGEKLFVDWAGQRIEYGANRHEVAYVFVATLGGSNFTFANVYSDMTLVNWLQAHIDTFTYLGGTPEVLVPDNTKTAVSKACFYDPDINKAYHELAQHYGCCVVPTRVYRPRDKAKVETAVQIVERRILAPLRHCQFHSLNDVRRAVRKKLIEMNQAPFSKKTGSRYDLFKAHEKPLLRALPIHDFAMGEWKKAKVDIDYHIQVDRHFYSVPYLYIGETLDVRLSAKTVEIFRQSNRVASHQRCFQPGKATTDSAHRPPHHHTVIEQSLGDLLSRATTIGPYTHKAAEQIVATYPRCEMAFRGLRGLLRLASIYSNDRLEQACSRALSSKICRYKTIKNILENHRETHPPSRSTPVHHSNIRGASYYQSYPEEPQAMKPCEVPKC